MELAVNWFTLIIDQFECVRPIAIHVTITVRSTTVREKEGDLMRSLRPQTDKVPKHVRILSGLREEE